VGFPLFVILHRFVREMSLPINFDGEFYPRAIEIDHITVNAMLPSEFEALYLFAFQMLPKPLFSVDGIVPQLPTLLFFRSFVIVDGHTSLPTTPNPLLAKAGLYAAIRKLISLTNASNPAPNNLRALPKPPLRSNSGANSKSFISIVRF